MCIIKAEAPERTRILPGRAEINRTEVKRVEFKKEGPQKGKDKTQIPRQRQPGFDGPERREALLDEELDAAAGGRRRLQTAVALSGECGLWRCREHWSNGAVMKDRYGFSKCPVCGAIAACKTCHYSKEQGSLLLCCNPKKEI